MSKLKIELVNEIEKYEKVKLVKPNIIFNRADIRFNNNFGLLKIDYNSEIKYIAFHLNSQYCYLCIYMMKIDKKVFDGIIKFIYKTFEVNNFYTVQSLNGNKQLNKTVHWLLNLPESKEEFDKQFSSKSKYNRRARKKALEKDFKCEFKHYDKNSLTQELFEKFLKLKRSKYENAYKNESAKDMLSSFYSITDVFTIELNNEIQAMILFSIIDDKEMYYTNIANNDEFSKYGLGEMLYYYGIENMIKRKIKKMYLGGGNYDYKLNSKAIKTDTFEGYFYYYPLIKKIFSIQKTKLPKNNWLEYYRKIKIEKRIKKLATQHKNKRILIYGAGLMSKTLFENYDLSSLNIKAICDKNYENKENETFFNYPCIGPKQINFENYDVILILVAQADKVINNLKYETYSNFEKYNNRLYTFIE